MGADPLVTVLYKLLEGTLSLGYYPIDYSLHQWFLSQFPWPYGKCSNWKETINNCHILSAYYVALFLTTSWDVSIFILLLWMEDTEAQRVTQGSTASKCQNQNYKPGCSWPKTVPFSFQCNYLKDSRVDIYLHPVLGGYKSFWIRLL